LGGEQQQGVVASAGPGGSVRACEQGVDLGVGEERDESALIALGWYGEHALNDQDVLRDTKQ
jgi:hypothetical protein